VTDVEGVATPGAVLRSATDAVGADAASVRTRRITPEAHAAARAALALRTARAGVGAAPANRAVAAAGAAGRAARARRNTGSVPARVPERARRTSPTASAARREVSAAPAVVALATPWAALRRAGDGDGRACVTGAAVGRRADLSGGRAVGAGAPLFTAARRQIALLTNVVLVAAAPRTRPRIATACLRCRPVGDARAVRVRARVAGERRVAKLPAAEVHERQRAERTPARQDAESSARSSTVVRRGHGDLVARAPTDRLWPLKPVPPATVPMLCGGSTPARAAVRGPPPSRGEIR
jgi:hypothetical protein